MIKPENSNWEYAFSQLLDGNGWPFSHDSVIGRVLNTGIDQSNQALSVGYELFVRKMTRILLLLTFVGIAISIFFAWKKRNTMKERSI